MRRLVLLFAAITIIPAALAEVNITVRTSRPGGWESDGRGFYLYCVDPYTGEVLHIDDDLANNEANSFGVDKTAHPQVVCWVLSYKQQGRYRKGPMVARKKVETSLYYENGYCGNSLQLPSEAEIGVCGDGNTSSMEACDTDGDTGCSPPTPECYNCEFCGCGSDSDCVQVTGGLGCGYGRCLPVQKPYNVKNSCIDGHCVLTYQCRHDADCYGDNGTEPGSGICLDSEEEAVSIAVATGGSGTFVFGNSTWEVASDPVIAGMTINGEQVQLGTDQVVRLEDGSLFMPALSEEGEEEYKIVPKTVAERKLNVLAFESHGGSDLEEMIDTINSNMDAIPDYIVGIFGNERMNLYVGESEMFMVTSDNQVVEMGTGLLTDPTMKVHTEMETLEGIRDGSILFSDAVMDGRVRYEPVGVISTVRLLFASIAAAVTGFFSSIFG